jgi:hypothetical protein
MRTINNRASQTSAPKQPRTIALNVMFPWFLVTIMAFSVAGVIGGWALRSQNIVYVDSAAATTSKTIER